MNDSEKLINKISEGKNLSFEESKTLFLSIMSGNITENLIYNFLKNLSDKGETWEEIAGGNFALCHNEVPTKVNWHYLRWQFDTQARRNVELQINDRVMDLRNIPVPVYDHKYYSCDRLLNFIFDVRTYMPVRNFLFLDSVVVSVDW